MSDSMIRAMANTLIDHDVDPLDAMAVVKQLIASGFTAKQIKGNYDALVLMALIRRRNTERENEHAYRKNNG
jgi:hypothetical protein